MISAGTVMAKMGIDMTAFNEGISAAGAKLKSAGSAAANMGTLATAAVTGAGVAAAGVLKSSISLAEGAQKTQANLEQTIKSTGGAAGLTAKQVEDMAAGFQKTTTFSKGTIENGQSMLLTFTKIGKDVFPQATQAMLDMAQKMGTDPKEAAMQLGKALNDPVKGVTALTRVGVTFSAQQKEQIKTMMKAGNVAGAQKVILNELNKEFGGQAQAAANTYDGKMKQLTNTINGMKASIGMALIPTLQILLQNIMKIIQPIATLVSQNPKLAAGVLSIVAVMGTLTGGISIVSKVVSSFGVLGTAISHLGGAFKTIGPMVTKAMSVFPKLIEGVSKVGNIFTRLGSVARMVFTALPGIISPPVLIAVGVIAGLGLIVYEVIKHWDTIKKSATALKNHIINTFNQWSANIKAGWNSITNFLKNINLFDIGKNIIQGLSNGIGSKVGEIVTKMKNIAGKIKDTIKSALGIHSPSTVFTGYGVNTSQGYINGLDKMQSPIQQRITSMANKIKNLGNVKPDFNGLDNAILGSNNIANGSHTGVNSLNNNQKHMEFKPTINMYVKLADTGNKGTQQLTNALKDMATKSLKDTVTDMFLKDAIRL